MGERHSAYDSGIHLAHTRARHDLSTVVAPPEWTQDALRAQVDPEVFFPDKGQGDHARQAKTICSRCTVSAECLDYALAYEYGAYGVATSYPAGIYGGLTERERRRLRRGSRGGAA